MLPPEESTAVPLGTLRASVASRVFARSVRPLSSLLPSTRLTLFDARGLPAWIQVQLGHRRLPIDPPSLPAYNPLSPYRITPI